MLALRAKVLEPEQISALPSGVPAAIAQPHLTRRC
jgi:hypothetical protein